ncbi:MAG: leucine-rich repeat domain-containing protein [Paludibacteraceae bacterium]|nr:leucine-rich repeat domain-containing protein [Paludibacteraceae bacterium]
MKKKLFITLCIAVAAALNVAAHDYAVPNDDNVTIYYTDVTATYGSPAVEVSYEGTWYGAVEGEYKDTVVIPDSIVEDGKQYAVVGIGEQAFAECMALKSVTIPATIVYIRDKAFQSCCHVTEINYNAVNCADFTLPEYAPFSFSNMAYRDYGGYQDEEDPTSWTTFDSYYDLSVVNIGAGVKRVPDFMFYGMGGRVQHYAYTREGETNVLSRVGVTAINFLGVPQELGAQAFRSCSMLRSITIPDGVKELGQALFADCDTLSSVTLPDDMAEIPAYFFMNCKELTGFTFPSQVTRINYEAFKNCAKLTDLNNLPSGLTVIGPSAFRSCAHITSVTLPASLTTIDGYAFSDCTALTAVNIPAGVAKIGNYAFEDCTNLATVTLHEGTEEIGNFVFAGCRKLSKGVVNAPARMPRIYAQTFQGVDNSMTVNVEGGETSAYAADAYWGRFFAPQGVEEVHSVREARKVVRNGQLVIIKGDKQFNILGTAL